MTDFILTISKYIIIIFFAYFVYVSFRSQRDVPDEKKKTSFFLQKIFIFVIHGLSFLTILINISINSTISLTIPNTIVFYLAQLAYLILISCVVPHFVSLSKGLNNVMCMFIAIGFIIQTRLDFTGSVKQFFVLLAGTLIFLIFIFFCKRATFLYRLTWVYCILGMVLLVMVLILSNTVKGAKLSLDLGFFSFQPMEFVKILFVLFLASAFSHSTDLKTLIITAVCAFIHVIIVVLCTDLGSALILSVIYILMLYVATKKVRYILFGIVGFSAASVIAYKAFSHVRVRIKTWINPWTDMDLKGYQITQSLFAIGTGGWFGAGLFRGAPKYVPQVTNDMVFAAISEELGGIFAILLILLCLCFTLLIMRVAIRIQKPFYKLLAFGLGCCYAVQVFLTIGGTIKFIPLTGVNLPFISNGGSSLISSMIMIGIVQALYVISEADVEYEREKIEERHELERLEATHVENINESAHKIVFINPDDITEEHMNPINRIVKIDEQQINEKKDTSQLKKIQQIDPRDL